MYLFAVAAVTASNFYVFNFYGNFYDSFCLSNLSAIASVVTLIIFFYWQETLITLPPPGARFYRVSWLVTIFEEKERFIRKTASQLPKSKVLFLGKKNKEWKERTFANFIMTPIFNQIFQYLVKGFFKLTPSAV